MKLNADPNLPTLGVSDKAVFSLLPVLRLPRFSETAMEVAFFYNFYLSFFLSLSFKQEYTVL